MELLLDVFLFAVHRQTDLTDKLDGLQLSPLLLHEQERRHLPWGQLPAGGVAGGSEGFGVLGDVVACSFEATLTMTSIASFAEVDVKTRSSRKGPMPSGNVHLPIAFRIFICAPTPSPRPRFSIFSLPSSEVSGSSASRCDAATIAPINPGSRAVGVLADATICVKALG